MEPYEPDYYRKRHEWTVNSARLIMAHVMDDYPSVRSVVDFGCGVGTFLRATCLDDVLGIDIHDGYGCLRVPEDRYMQRDISKPFRIGRRFGMALCLEVAEHLPESAALTLCSNIADCSDLVLWSAATPGQGGVGHVNEQPFDYWKEIWNGLGYAPRWLSTEVLLNNRVLQWYRKNLVYFIKRCG